MQPAKKSKLWEPTDKSLVFNDFVPIGRTLKPGETSRHNHQVDDCQGESKSLTITRTKNGTIYGRCFRCGRKGIYRGDMERAVPKRIEGRYVTDTVMYIADTNKKLLLPADITYNWKDWPVEARLFLRKAYMDETDAKIYKISYSPRLGKVVLALYNNADELLGYQLRRVLPEDTSPKYITKAKSTSVFSHINRGTDVCVLVEDRLSGIRIANAGVSSVCMMGTHLTPKMINILAKHYQHVIVFLDNDNNIVKKKQQEMKSELLCWIPRVSVIYSDRQPKEYTKTELKDLLANYYKDVPLTELHPDIPINSDDVPF